MQTYEDGSRLLKAIAEPIRLEILHILSHGEMCACDILPNLSISQSTLSYHMKALSAAGWVNARKKATWMYYAINENTLEVMHQYLLKLTMPKQDLDSLISGSCEYCETDKRCSCQTTSKRMEKV